MTRVKTAGGRFDPAEPFIFFLAGAAGFRGSPLAKAYPHLLFAVTEMDTCPLDPFILDGGSVFLDSGIFPLTMAHARAHGTTMDVALGLAPDVIDGFDDLLTAYMDAMRRYGKHLWGYTELDQGGVDNKRKTRAYLEGEGLRPIPVYHPLNDGWDYLDELVDGYDRICIGNVVWASASTRRDLLFTISERLRRARKAPWVHVLGHTPNPLFNAVPFNSSDSTTHNYSFRYGSSVTFGRAMLGQFSRLGDRGFSYDQASSKADPERDRERGYFKASDFLAWVAATDLRCQRAITPDLEEALGQALPVYPRQVRGEKALVKP